MLFCECKMLKPRSKNSQPVPNTKKTENIAILQGFCNVFSSLCLKSDWRVETREETYFASSFMFLLARCQHAI
ncbi:hypothetical protein EMPG_10981 [Blastomyces silverae]|uniref:Uncharacterized protein n=1 Tax=Blastomyces silverae TaxID=2060906 RepID=A0A0H1B8F6_9EURO|nr:hypothetical protein EMPG_10981 [Blastomyces silverae]